MYETSLPRHARTGLIAVGWRNARTGEDGPQPIWPILGGAPTEDEQDDDQDDQDDADKQDDDQDDAAKPEDAEQLGAAGQKALDAVKARYRAERARRRQAEQDLATHKQQTEAKPTEGEGDEAPDLDKIREEGRTAARAEGLRERALDRLEAKAARTFADPEDARAHLAGRVEEFVDGDRIDTEAITEALEELLAKKPYLGSAEAAMATKRFKDGGDGGARDSRQSPKGQLEHADLKNMTAAQIRSAKADGRLNTLLGRSK